MSAGTLPSYIDVQKWADRQAVIDQVVPLASFARLCEGAVDNRGEVSVQVRLQRDAQGLFVLEGTLATHLPLVCQRCLEPVDTALDAEVRLWLLRDEAKAALLPDEADYLVQDEEGRIALADVLEDELILALPLVPLHDNCTALAVANDVEEDAAAAAPRRENPFQVLAGFKAEPDEQ